MPLTQEQIDLAKDIWDLDRMGLSKVNLEKAFNWFGKEAEKVLADPCLSDLGYPDHRLSDQIGRARHILYQGQACEDFNKAFPDFLADWTAEQQ